MKTVEIVADIKNKIETGQVGRGDTLPGTTEAAQAYGVSRATVMNAHAILANLGLIATRRGRNGGAMVIAGPTTAAHLGSYGRPDVSAPVYAAPDDTSITGGTVSVRQIDAGEDPEARILGITGPAIKRTHVRQADNIPFQHKISVYPLDVAQLIPEGETVAPMMLPVGADGPTLPEGVRYFDWVGIGPVEVGTAISVEPVTEEAAQSLGIPEGTPGFRVMSVFRDESGRIVAGTVQANPLHHKLTMTSHG